MKDADLEILKHELRELLDKIKTVQKEVADTTLKDACEDVDDTSQVALRTRHLLKGHISKISCVHFSRDNRHLVSGGLDGKLIIWDTWTGNKVRVIPLKSNWLMTVTYSNSGKLVSCGGMDNMCTVYDLGTSGNPRILRELTGMKGFLSCSCFLNDSTVITGSADATIIKWDLEKGVKINEFVGHHGDVMSMSLSPDGNFFVTGSVDKTSMLWDVRHGPRCKQTFWAHDSDVNSVSYHSSGYYFGSGSDDKTARLFDVRADQQIGCYKPPTLSSGFTSCVLSRSGRLIICGSDDFSVHFWDTLKENHVGLLRSHENRITSISIPENGMSLASGSWDMSVRLWN